MGQSEALLEVTTTKYRNNIHLGVVVEVERMPKSGVRIVAGGSHMQVGVRKKQKLSEQRRHY